MHRVGRRLLLALLALVMVGLGGLALLLQRAPLVARGADVSPGDVRRARSLVARNDPRRARAGAVRTVSLSRQDATLMVQYGASRWRQAAARFTLREGGADVEASLSIPSNPFGRFLNVRASLADADGLPQVTSLRIGHLPLPASAAMPLLEWFAARAGAEGGVTLVRTMLQRTAFTTDSVRVTYQWRADAIGSVRDMLMAPSELARLEVYHRYLASLVADAPQRGPLALPIVLAPMLALAQTRAASGDAAEEHRAALATLALYVTGRNLGMWLRQAKSWAPIPRRAVTLSGREDLAKHFLVSAIVAAEADRMLADAVGLTKEVDDSRGGTGFSFVDLAADRAGTRLGELAVGEPEELQERLSRGLAESDIMPPIDGLPESLTEAEFVARFGGVDAPAYAAMVRTIDARLQQLPLLR